MRIPIVRSLESFHVGEHTDVLGEWGTWRGHGSSTPLPTYLALCISSVFMFACILYHILSNKLVNSK